MSAAAEGLSAVDLLGRVQDRAVQIASRAATSIGAPWIVTALKPGKMIRTRMAARLACEGGTPVRAATLECLCAATELVHTASLCHDDVIDRAALRRGRPSLWKETGASVAVLVGDLLLCEAMDLALAVEDGRYGGLFVAKMHELCRAEAEHELLLRGAPVDEETCLRLARGKTGALFAFVAAVCGAGAPGLSSSLEEAGYRVGAAYQLADDLVDVIGDERTAGKTLGSDHRRGKFTLAADPAGAQQGVSARLEQLFRSALDCVDAWPAVRRSLADFLELDLMPVFSRYAPCLGEVLSKVT